MQRTRNLVWAVISYGLLTVWLLDPSTILSIDSLTLSTSVDSKFFIIISVSLLLGMLVKSRIFVASSTVIHELGHAFAVGLTGGQVKSLRANLDTSGITSWSGKPGRFSGLVVSVAGPLANAILFATGIRALIDGFSSNSFHLIALTLLVITFTSVRNLWGWVTSIVAIAFLVFASSVIHGSPIVDLPVEVEEIVQKNVLVAVAALLSFNAGIGLRYSFRCRSPKDPGMDEFKVASYLGIPKAAAGHSILLVNFAILAGSFLYILEKFTN